jgi:hypothetical protein
LMLAAMPVDTFKFPSVLKVPKHPSTSMPRQRTVWYVAAAIAPP